MALHWTGHEGNLAHEDALIADLPTEVALSILARLPCVHYPRLRCVCRAWNDAFQSSGLVVSFRRALGMLEAWPLVRIRRANKPCRWYVIDPQHRSSHRIPSAPSIHIEDAAGSELCIFAAYRYDMCGRLHFHSFDASGMQWQHSQVPAMSHSRVPAMPFSGSSFTCAILDDYWYVVGGHAHDRRIVERIHIGNPNMLSSWECIPHMHQARKCAQAISRQGCLYVLGGRRRRSDPNTEIYSGEIWNLRKEEWTLVPELWPFKVFGGHPSHEIAIAVVMGTLFALKKLSKELMCYDDGKQEWVNLGQVPLESNERFRKLLGVGSDLWLFSFCGRHTDVDNEEDGFWYELRIFDVAFLSGTASDMPPNLSWKILRFKFDGEMDVFEHSVVHM